MAVSTVFLGIDHGFGMWDYPILWETMIFGLPDNEDYQERYTSAEDAIIGHHSAVMFAFDALKK